MSTSQIRVTLTAAFERGPEGGYTCCFLEFPEVFCEGESIEEAEGKLIALLQPLIEDYSADEWVTELAAKTA